MKKQLWIAAACGAGLGLAVAVNLMGIAMPNFKNYFLTVEQAQDYELLDRFKRFYELLAPFTRALVFLCALGAWRALLSEASPAWAASSFRRDRGIFWLGWALALLLPLVAVNVDLMDGFDTGQRELAAWLAPFAGLIWLLLSPEGLTSMDAEERKRTHGIIGLLLLWVAGFAGVFALLDRLDAGTALSVVLIMGWTYAPMLAIFWLRARGDQRLRLPRASWGGLVGAASWGALYGLLCAALLAAAQKLFNFYFEWTLTVGSGSSEPNGPGVLLLTVGMLLLLGGLLTVLTAWVPAFRADGAALDERVARAKRPLALLLAAGLVVGAFYGRAVQRNSWSSGGLAEAASLPDRTPPPAKTLVGFGLDGKGKPKVELQRWELMVRPFGWVQEAQEIPASEANARALEAFLEAQDSKSRYYLAAMDALPQVLGRLWDPRGAFMRMQELKLAPHYKVRQNLLDSSLSFSWVCQSAVVSAESRGLLERYSDESLYVIPAKSALRLAKAWHRFGDGAKAAFWEERAAKAASSDESLAKDLADYRAQREAPIFNGRVSGRVTLQGAPAGARIQVGLFSAGGDKKLAYTGISNTSSRQFRLVAVQTLPSGGRFSFEKLSAHHYFIGLLIDGDLKRAPAKHPGVPKLSRARPSADLGEIVVKL